MLGVLKPYKVLIEQLQRTDQPEQHLAARRTRHFFMVMKQSWIGTKDREPVFACRAFREWIDDMKVQGKNELITLVKKECRSLSSVLVGSIKERLSSTWNHIQALELIDPLGPEIDRHTTPDVWVALRDLCERRDIDFDSVQSDIIEMRSAAIDFDNNTKTHIRTHLCGYLGDRLSGFVSTLQHLNTTSCAPPYLVYL